MKTLRTCLCTMAILGLSPSFALQKGLPLSQQLKLKNLDQIETVNTRPILHEKLLKEDALDEAAGIAKAYRYADSVKLNVDPRKQGTYTEIPGKGLLWQIKIHCPHATDLNFGFRDFELPEGATMHFWSVNHDYYQGPYTAKDNDDRREFWSPVIPGDTGVVEVFIPDTATFDPKLHLTHVGGGYRDLFSLYGNAKQDPCHIDVVCAQASAYRNEAQSVGRISVGGSGFCSGAMIKDVPETYRNWFLTAAHCGISPGNAGSVVVYWNFQSPQCGDLCCGSLNDNQRGSTFRSSDDAIDSCLIELDDDPDPNFNVYYSGWDRSDNPANTSFGIHHPAADEKAISFSTTRLISSSNCAGISGPDTHWTVVWSSGVTEPGSSGSPLYDQAGRKVVGFLTGGISFCVAPNDPDCYGKVSAAWKVNNNSPRRSLAPWLDPADLGVLSTSGSFLNGVGGVVVTNSVGLVSTNFPGGGSGNTGNPPLTNPVLITPDGGEVFVIGDEVQVVWDQVFSGLPPDTQVSLEFTPDCNDLNTVYEEDVENGRNGWSFDGQDPAQWWPATSDFRGQGFSWFARDREFIQDSYLVSPPILIPQQGRFGFRHRYDLEIGRDGGVLEISTSGPNGPWKDLGTDLLVGRYSSTIAPQISSPIAGRSCWSGNSVFYRPVVVDLEDFAGLTAWFRFRLATNDSQEDSGWWVDDFEVYSERSWYNAGQGAVDASSMTWTVPFEPGTDYCVRIRNEAPFYLPSAWVYGDSFALYPPNPTDSDALPDAWEIANRLDPLDASDVNKDADGDGKTNLEEYRAGTDPQDASSVLMLSISEVTDKASTPDQIEFKWDSVPGKLYSVWTSDTLGGSWTPVLDNISATPPRNYHTLAIPDGKPAYYHIDVR